MPRCRNKRQRGIGRDGFQIARIQPPCQVEGRPQRLHPGRRGKRECEERRQVALQMGVARPEFIDEPAVFQPLPRPAALDGCPQRLLVHRRIEIYAGRRWRTDGIQEQLQRGEDQVQSGFRLTPKRAPACGERMVGAPTHPR
jgi:hypothetical protein